MGAGSGLKPTTMMNRSGAARVAARRSAFLPATDLLVISDDFNIPLGTFRLRAAGSAGGHNGLKSIEGALQSQDYARLRVGIGPLPAGDPWEDFVLSPCTAEEREQIDALLPQVVEVVETWVREGVKG
jgi:PTH1 family peptidyl-tRNA hydrolase